MTLPFPTLLVAHRGFGEGLLAAAEAILGERPAVDLVSNEGLSPEALGRAIDGWLEGHPGPAVILVDLGFGSCCQTARRVTRHRETVAVVAGINLPALLAAVRSREHADLPAFLRHLEERGRGGFEVFLGGERR
jgi:mannose/fructose-specific phosphotransferase system component IIA